MTMCARSLDSWRNIASLTMSAVSRTFRAHYSMHAASITLTNSPCALPWLEAVIIPLADDLPVFELEEHGGVGTHLGPD